MVKPFDHCCATHGIIFEEDHGCVLQPQVGGQICDPQGGSKFRDSRLLRQTAKDGSDDGEIADGCLNHVSRQEKFRGDIVDPLLLGVVRFQHVSERFTDD